MKCNGDKQCDLKTVSKTFLYYVINIGLIVLLFAAIINTLVTYNKWPIYTEVIVVPQNQAKYPAITMCPISNGYKENVLQENGIESIKNYNYKYNLTWTSNNTQLTPQQLFLDATYSLSDLVKAIKIRHLDADTNGSFVELLKLEESASWVTQQYHRAFGRCYTLYPEKYTRDLGIYYIALEFLINAKLYIHAKDQFLDLSGRMGYKVYLGERFECQVTVQEIIQLEYRNVKNALALSSEDKSCSYQAYDECMYNKVYEVMKKNTADECTVPWIKDNDRICSKSDDINTTFWIAWNRITNQKKDCFPPCDATLVNVGAKNRKELEHKNHSQVYFYFSPRVMKSEEHYLYSFLKLIGQIGGYLGMYRIVLWFLDLCHFNRLKEKAPSKRSVLTHPKKEKDDNLVSLSILAIDSI